MKELITSLGIILTGIVTIILTVPLADTSRGLAKNPALFPQIISIILVGLGVVLLLRALRGNQREKIGAPGKPFFKLLGLFLILALYLPAMRYFGFLVATALFLFTSLVFSGNQKKIAAIFTVVCSLVLYLIFAVAFKVPLPKGLLW